MDNNLKTNSNFSMTVLWNKRNQYLKTTLKGKTTLSIENDHKRANDRKFIRHYTENDILTCKTT